MPLSKFESFLTNTKLDIEVGSQKTKKYVFLKPFWIMYLTFRRLCFVLLLILFNQIFKTVELEWIPDRCHDVSEAHCLHHDHLDLRHQQDLPEQDQEEVGCQQAEV